MTAEPVSLDELVAVRESLIDLVVGMMPEPHRRFLVSFERGEPDWQLLGCQPHVICRRCGGNSRTSTSWSLRSVPSFVRQLEAVLAKPAI